MSVVCVHCAYGAVVGCGVYGSEYRGFGSWSSWVITSSLCHIVPSHHLEHDEMLCGWWSVRSMVVHYHYEYTQYALYSHRLYALYCYLCVYRGWLGVHTHHGVLIPDRGISIFGVMGLDISDIRYWVHVTHIGRVGQQLTDTEIPATVCYALYGHIALYISC